MLKTIIDASCYISISIHDLKLLIESFFKLYAIIHDQ